MVKKVVLAGGGVLGVQIALMSAYTGHDTTIWLRSEGSIGRTQPKIEHYEAAILGDIEQCRGLVGSPMVQYLYPRGLFDGPQEVTGEKITEKLAQARENFAHLLHLELDLERALDGAEVVIEAMSEDPQAKRSLYERMRPYLPEDAILLTNSSTLLPGMLADATPDPARFCALHFANTIWRQNTAEVMGHAGTSEETYRRAVDFAREIHMIALQLHREQPGYLLNSMLVPFLLSAGTLLAKGVADPQTIDRTWELGTGAPKGPFKIIDTVGLDTAYNITMLQADARREGTPLHDFAAMLKEKIDRGEKGINFGKGFYEYPAGK